MSSRTGRKHRRASRKPPASGRRPSDKMSARDVNMSGDELLVFHRQFQLLFQRREQRNWSLRYLCGQLSNLERKTIEPMVLAQIGADPNAIRGMQQFIGHGAWDSTLLMIQAQSLVSSWFGEEDGVVIVDGSGFPKEGRASVGVARQYCGHLGKIANCQEGVFLVYASRQGYAFVDERLYMPEEWFSDTSRKRWKACRIPEMVVFHTEPELGLEMIGALVQRDVIPFRWVTCDESYGKIPAFLDGIASLGKWYLAEVPSDTRVWLRRPAIQPPGCGPLGRPRVHPRVKPSAPRPLELCTLMKQLPASIWHRRIIKEGSKGPLKVELAFVRVTPVRNQLPGSRCWAIFRRSLGSQPETKFYLSNAPADCPQAELIRITGMRWPVETAFEEAKGEVGLDHYETRTWQGWHHHMLQSFLAHLFLMRLRLLFQKKVRHSRPLRLANWWHPPSKAKPSACPIFLPSYTTTNPAIMPLIILTANELVRDHTDKARIIINAKSRSNNRNLVVP
jgi:SRSO17 transposase